jgi:hypothetical protein
MFGKIIGSLLILTGVFFFYKAGAQYHYGKKSLDWPTAPGTVTLSKWRRAGGSQPGYKAKIEYDYTVGGDSYHSGFIGFSEFNDPNHAYRFKKGKRCSVYYNPDDPAMSVLVRVFEAFDRPVSRDGSVFHRLSLSVRIYGTFHSIVWAGTTIKIIRSRHSAAP